MSMDLGSWMVVLEDTLGSLAHIADKCKRRVYETYDDLLGYGRYLKFTAKSYHSLSAGLNNINWHYLI